MATKLSKRPRIKLEGERNTKKFKYQNTEFHKETMNILNSLGIKDPECEIIEREEFERNACGAHKLFSTSVVTEISTNKNTGNKGECGDEDDQDVDIAVVGTNGEGPSSWPHKREHCERYNTVSEQYCPNCFCSICDKFVSECKSWKDHWKLCQPKPIIHIGDDDCSEPCCEPWDDDEDNDNFDERYCLDCGDPICEDEPYWKIRCLDCWKTWKFG